MSRQAVLEALAERIAAIHLDHPVRVGIDGVDGAGKTTLADELVVPVDARGRPVVRASEDDFHRCRAVRYRRGADSPEGYYRDSFDLDAIRSRLLDPLGPGGDRRVRRRAFDYRTDRAVDAPLEAVPADAVLLFDGVFLHRPELRSGFDLTVFLDVPFDVTVARQVERDGTDPDVEAPSNRRYVGGQRIYLEDCEPRSRADVVVDNREWRAPRILPPGPPGT